MNNCSQCGSQVPDGQSICSICYGDMDYGRDGYYRQQMERDEYEEAEWYFCPGCMSGDIKPLEEDEDDYYICNQCKTIFIL